MKILRGLLSILVISVGTSLALTSNKMEDGDFLKIVSVPTGNVLTLSGTDTNDGRPLQLGAWSGQSNQKFLAVEAVPAGDSFLLMPQRQRYPWQRFIRNGGTAPYKNRHDDLPDWTLVLEANTNTGAVTQDARDSKQYQQWRAVKVASTSSGDKNKYQIKNRQNNYCLQAPGPAPIQLTTTTQATPMTTTTKRSGFFSNIWSSIRGVFGSSNSDSSSTRSSRSNSQSGSSSPTGHPTNVIIASCDTGDVRQHWQLESIAYEY